MKKILLLAAAAAYAAGVYAQGPNMVVNGNFENPAYEQSIPSGYTWDPWDKQNYLTVLPGWNLSTGGEWNGGIEVLTGDDWIGDGFTRPEDDLNVLRFIGFNDNGWTNVAITQVVTGLTPGTSYDFDYLVAARFPTAEETANNWAPDPNFGYAIAEVDKDAEGNEIAGKEIASANLASNSLGENGSIDMFNAGPVSFEAPADGRVFVRIYMANTYGDKNKKDNLWMLCDMVSIVDPNGDTGVEAAVATENAPVEYFNLQGLRVANPENGIFIRRQGSKVSKVVL